MLNFRSRSVLFFSYLILLYGLYFFVITPLLWIKLKPYFTVELSPNASLIYWITAFVFFMIILLISIALRTVCCEKKKKPPQLPLFMLAGGRPRVTITQGAGDISSGENSVEFNETKKDEFDIANSNTRINLKSSLKLSMVEIGTQTQPVDVPPDLPASPLTPREVFFYDMLRDGTNSYANSSIKLGQPKHVYIQEENTRQLSSKLIDDQDLYKNYNELFKFINKKNDAVVLNAKPINSNPNEDDSVPNENKAIIDDQQMAQINRYKRLSSREYYFVPQPEHLESGREILKSEVFIEVPDESDKRPGLLQNKISIPDDDVFH